MTYKDFTAILSNRIAILDGGMGTMIMQAGLTESDFRDESLKEHSVALKGCNDLLNITRPEIIHDIHCAYINAGADIISTNTFNANSLSLAEYKIAHRVSEICKAGVDIARKAVGDSPVLIAGSMGPTGVALSLSPERFDEMAEAYEVQASALINAGVDLLLLETVFDTLNAKAAVYGIRKAFENTSKVIPLMISATLTETGRLLSGQTLKQFVEALDYAQPISFGINCSFGAGTLTKYIQELSAITQRYVSIHPNAGLPDAMGRYDCSPERMSLEMARIMQLSAVNIVGGCCGTSPEHIHMLAQTAKRYAPRNRAEVKPTDGSSSFIKVGERCNVAGSRKFLRLVKESNWSEALNIAATQLEQGAKILDINMDDAMIDAQENMVEFISRLTSDSRTAAATLMIDSSDFNVISRALRYLPSKGIVNSISLKNGEENFIRQAKEINALGCAMVVMAFDEQGQADTFDRRIEICSRAYELLTRQASIPPSDIIFDPNVLAVATGIAEHADYALDFINATEWIKQNLPGARVSGGVSNLSFSFRGIDPIRKAIHSVFLEKCIQMGMDMAIINPTTPLESEWIEPELHNLIEDLLLNRRSDATERIVAYASSLKIEKSSKQESVVKENISPCQLLAHALVVGELKDLDSIIDNALKECGGSAMAVVDKALMVGMNQVGQKFANGEMFLPQVVRSASFMKKAVEKLVPIIESDAIDSVSRPLMVLATVKGDVHDIGKNIVAIVMRCSGYDVLDLGVMTPPEVIVSTAIERNASAIGLSGLITPSLHEMTVVAKMMEEKGLHVPLFVGGATTSDIHTAVKIAPEYSGVVVHTGDAASLPGAVAKYTNDSSAVEVLKHKQQLLREEHIRESSLLTLDKARSLSEAVDSPASAPRHPGCHILRVKVQEIIPLINWRAFSYEWGLNPNSNDDKIISDANLLLSDSEIRSAELTAKVIITEAQSDGDDIIINNRLRIPTLRSLSPNPISGKCVAMADFIHSHSDNIGLFCVTVAGSGIPEKINQLKNSDEYRSLLLQSLSHRLVEAATEWMHRHVRSTLWGIPEAISIRPAVGYASLPDQSLVFLLDEMLDYSSMGVLTTNRGALAPSATTTGLIIAHPSARYFSVGPLSENARADYAKRRGLDLNSLSVFI